MTGEFIKTDLDRVFTTEEPVQVGYFLRKKLGPWWSGAFTLQDWDYKSNLLRRLGCGVAAVSASRG